MFCSASAMQSRMQCSRARWNSRASASASSATHCFTQFNRLGLKSGRTLKFNAKNRRILATSSEGNNFRSRRCIVTKSALEDRASRKRVLVPIADGTEEMEAVIIVDVLRRAGVEVIVASVEFNRLEIQASRGVSITADIDIDSFVTTGNYVDAIAVPGGMPGAERLRASEPLSSLLVAHASRGGLYAAICAAPAVVLEPLGLLNGKKCTCHPAFINVLKENENLDVDEGKVSFVSEGQCITSRGPGTAFSFALKIVSTLCGIEKAKEVAGPMCLPIETINEI